MNFLLFSEIVQENKVKQKEMQLHTQMSNAILNANKAS